MKKFAVLSVVAGLLLAVFSAVPASASPDTNSGRVLKVAVIGDSYTAGNGAGAYPNFNRDGSFYSLNNWGNKYVQWLNDQGVNAQLVAPLAYGGSVADDLLCVQNGTYRSTYSHDDKQCEPTDKERKDNNPGNQIARIPSDVDIVLLTIGGNDVHFTDIVKQCFTKGLRDPEDCSTQVGRASTNLRKKVDYSKKQDGSEKEASVREKTETVLRALDEKLKPGAEVVLVGYPLLATNRPYALVYKKTNAEVVDGDVIKATEKYPAGARVRALGMEATKLQQSIVDEWNAQNGDHVKVTYVGSIADVFAGHEPDPSTRSRNGDDDKKMGLHLGRWINEFFETETREVTGTNGKTRIISKSTLSGGHQGILDHGSAIGGMDNWYHPGVTGHEMIAREIARVVGVPLSVHSVSESEPVDVVLVVDGTGSMGQARSVLTQEVGQIVANTTKQSASARFGVVSYGDCSACGGDYVARVDTGFTTDTRAIESAIDALDSVEHQKDVRQGTVYSGINEALNLDWRVDARKIAIVIGDGTPREPEPDTGYTSEHIRRLSAEAGGVEIYAIDTSETWELNKLANDSMKALTQTTGGQTYTASTLHDIPVFIDNTISDSLSKPSAWLEPAGGYVGDEIMFDARGSYSINGKITRYEWDSDGDGIYEQATTIGTLTRSFDTPIEATARVRVTDETGHTSIATALVLVTVEPESLPEADTSTLQDKPGVSEVLDEEAIALFPELAPIAKDATLPDTRTEPNNSTPTHTPTTTHLPNTGTQTGTTTIVTVLALGIGLVFVALKRRSTQN